LYLIPADWLVTAGCTMVLLVVILPAGRMVSAGGPLDTTGTASTVPTSAAMDSAAS
ncbi:hypothetical protein Tco_0541643, partial [Tanacetum coccineum]